MKSNNQVQAVFSRTQFDQNLGTKSCITLVQKKKKKKKKCDDRGIVITANLEFREKKIFSLTIIYKKIFEILYIMRNKFQRSHQSD